MELDDRAGDVAVGQRLVERDAHPGRPSAKQPQAVPGEAKEIYNDQ